MKEKLITMILAFAAMVNIALAEEDREFASKTLHLKFDDVEEAQEWSLRGLARLIVNNLTREDKKWEFVAP